MSLACMRLSGSNPRTESLTGSSSNEARDSRIKEVVDKHLVENEVTIKLLRLLFETRYNKPMAWPRVQSARRVYFDCEGLVHYLMTGTIGPFDKTESPKIYKLEDFKKTHEPYTGYKIWQPIAPWVRETMGFWKPVHYFMHLEDGEYISKNGSGPIKFFDSFEKMLKEDAFPYGFTTEDNKEAKSFEEAVIGESLVGTIR